MENEFCDPSDRSMELGLVPCEHRKRFPKDEQGICTKISVSRSQTGLKQLYEVFCQGNRCRNHLKNEVCSLKAGEQEFGNGLQLDVKGTDKIQPTPGCCQQINSVVSVHLLRKPIKKAKSLLLIASPFPSLACFGAHSQQAHPRCQNKPSLKKGFLCISVLSKAGPYLGTEDFPWSQGFL